MTDIRNFSQSLAEAMVSAEAFLQETFQKTQHIPWSYTKEDVLKYIDAVKIRLLETKGPASTLRGILEELHTAEGWKTPLPVQNYIIHVGMYLAKSDNSFAGLWAQHAIKPKNISHLNYLQNWSPPGRS